MAISAAIAFSAVVAGVSAHGARKDAKRARQQMERDSQRRSAELETLLKENPVMPLPDDDAARRARRRSTTVARQRSGRASTLLSDSPATGLGG